MLIYMIRFETEKEYIKAGTFKAKRKHVDENLIRAALNKYLLEDVNTLDPDDIYNCTLIRYDGKYTQQFDLNPTELWALVERNKNARLRNTV